MGCEGFVQLPFQERDEMASPLMGLIIAPLTRLRAWRRSGPLDALVRHQGPAAASLLAPTQHPVRPTDKRLVKAKNIAVER